MKKPMPPKSQEELINSIPKVDQYPTLTKLLLLYQRNGISKQPYLPWDKIRFKTPPHDLTHEQWWLAIKFARNGMYRHLDLVDKNGRQFIYALPDEVLEETDYIASYASGQIRQSELVTDPMTRDRYLVSQHIEEAITSSQLEGASTTRKVAREMIRSGRTPHNRSERMILNNFFAMQKIGELRNEELSIELICEIHRIVTDGTLENPSSAGRFQLPEEERVAVWNNENELLHNPPPAIQLPQRVHLLCDFANRKIGSGYLPGVLRALTLHFMIGYEHPFEDGNGRTARALFYWSMLNQGYWLTEFLSVSRILNTAPGKYARSFLYTETDDNDLTYFFVYHLGVLHRAINDLHQYLAHKMDEIRTFRSNLSRSSDIFNMRQIALLQHALTNPTTRYSVQSHKISHHISTETARSDLLVLERLGLLQKKRTGKKFIFDPIENLAEALQRISN